MGFITRCRVRTRESGTSTFGPAPVPS